MFVIGSIDFKILDFIHSFSGNTFFDKIMVFITTLGNQGRVWIAISVALILFKKTRLVGFMALITLLFSWGMGEGLLKHIIQRQRPFITHSGLKLLIEAPKSSSFPSGHTTNAFAVAYILAVYYKKYSFYFWSLAGLIAFSRMYLFLHYPSDILAGVFLGILCGMLIHTVFTYAEKKIGKKYQNTEKAEKRVDGIESIKS